MKINLNKNNLRKLNGNGKLVRTKIIAPLLVASALLTGCGNREIFDKNYGFDKAIIKGEGSNILFYVKEWKDYSDGEQLQLVADDSFTLLTSSFDTDFVYGESTEYNAETLAHNAVSDSKELYYIGEDDGKKAKFNKTLIDTKYAFNKMFIHNKNKGIILPIQEWRDYEGEQLQVITNDGLVVVGCSYNSNLINDSNSNIKAIDYARSYLGSDGEITDLAEEYRNTDFNLDIIDTKYAFNKAIIMKDNTIVILPIDKWNDYEGEQLQLKVHGGPAILTASYDTLLISDSSSKIKAVDLARKLSENVIDYSEGFNKSGFNAQIFDFDYGFSNAIISGKDSATTVRVDEWCDYDGEQLQINTKENDVILSSSMILDFVNAGSKDFNVSSLAKNYISEEGKLVDKSNGDYTDSGFNKKIFDLENAFNYAIKINDGNVLIIPLKKWKDYNVSTDDEVYKAEELQLVLPEDSVILTTAYNTVLVKTNDINRVAEYFRGKDGVITDLTPYVGEPNNNGWNLTIFDTKHNFEYAIYTNENTTQVIPINKWMDYIDGEQLQVRFTDNSGMLTSYVNTTLVKPNTENLEEVIAKALVGQKEDSKVKIYK